MVKREKRLRKSIVSIKKQIEEHFGKLEKEVENKDWTFARYHLKEIDKSLIDDLEYRMKLLGVVDKDLLERYRRKLGKITQKLDVMDL
jgi:hypothetical protein